MAETVFRRISHCIRKVMRSGHGEVVVKVADGKVKRILETVATKVD